MKHGRQEYWEKYDQCRSNSPSSSALSIPCEVHNPDHHNSSPRSQYPGSPITFNNLISRSDILNRRNIALRAGCGNQTKVIPTQLLHPFTSSHYKAVKGTLLLNAFNWVHPLKSSLSNAGNIAKSGTSVKELHDFTSSDVKVHCCSTCSTGCIH